MQRTNTSLSNLNFNSALAIISDKTHMSSSCFFVTITRVFASSVMEKDFLDLDVTDVMMIQSFES